MQGLISTASHPLHQLPGGNQGVYKRHTLYLETVQNQLGELAQSETGQSAKLMMDKRFSFVWNSNGL